MIPLAIKFFQISADWLLLTFTTVQAITELRSYKQELRSVQSYNKTLHVDGNYWWLIFPYQLYLEKKDLKHTLSQPLPLKDANKIKRSRSFLLRAEAWLYIVLGSSFYLISTTIDSLTSLVHAPTYLVIITPFLLVLSGLTVANRFMRGQ